MGYLPSEVAVQDKQADIFASTVLEDLVSQGDEAGFRELSYRVANHGAAPPRGSGASNISASNNIGLNGTGQNYGMAPGYLRPQQLHNVLSACLPLPLVANPSMLTKVYQ